MSSSLVPFNGGLARGPGQSQEAGGNIVHQTHHASHAINELISSIEKLISNMSSKLRLRIGATSSLARVRSALDVRATVRFVVVIFSHFMGIATIFSFNKAPNRPNDALPSLDDDGYPIMVAQVAASMLSPLLFGIVSARKTSTPLRRKIFSFYYVLLVIGVIMSLLSLLLYSLWPSGYRVTNLATMASLMFAVLGGWQFLEKCWKETGAGEDIELQQA